MNSIDDNITISINALNGNIRIKTSKAGIQILLSIFKTNKEGHTLIKQVADKEFFDKLAIIGGKLKTNFPSIYKTIDFLEKIPKNSIFIVCWSYLIEDSTINKIYEIQRVIYRLNDIEYNSDLGKIANSYNTYVFGEQRLFIGASDKTKRICRFCGKTSPEVTFKKTAHAISESLGNKKLFCHEECDSCNEKFSKIEQDLYNFIAFYFSMYGETGKKGKRSLKGKNIKIDKNSNLISIKSNDENIFNDIEKGIQIEIEEPILTYSNLNIYKCLCKFAISLIDKMYLHRLTNTIEWISSNDVQYTLPFVWWRCSHIHSHPIMGIYCRKETADKHLPEFIVRLYIFNLEYLFILPFIDGELFTISEEIKSSLQEIFSIDKFVEVDMSSDEVQNMKITFNVKSAEGSEVVHINKSEYDTLTDNERAVKYPNASAFIITDDYKIDE